MITVDYQPFVAPGEAKPRRQKLVLLTAADVAPYIAKPYPSTLPVPKLRNHFCDPEGSVREQRRYEMVSHYCCQGKLPKEELPEVPALPR